MSQLPFEDQPPQRIPGTDAEAQAAMGPMTHDNPVAVGAWFLNALTEERGPNVQALRQLVTPESLPAWGDFREVADVLAGCGMTSRANEAVGDPDVVYVKYLTSPDENYKVDRDTVMMMRAVGTLVRRPSLGGWRVHGMGDYIRPEQVPHD